MNNFLEKEEIMRKKIEEKRDLVKGKIRGGHSISKTDIMSIVEGENVQTEEGIVLDDEQIDCLCQVLSYHTSFLYGEAGAGKSVILSALKKICESLELDIVVTATTGLASTHIGGSTVQSALAVPYYASTRNKIVRKDKEYPLKKDEKGDFCIYDIVIIDECSMLGILPYIMMERRYLEKQQGHPCKIIFSGDFAQAPAIVSEAEVLAFYRYLSDNIFSSDMRILEINKKILPSDLMEMMLKLGVIPVHIKGNRRTTNEEYAQVLSKLSKLGTSSSYANRVVKELNNLISQRGTWLDSDVDVYLAATKKVVSEINSDFLNYMQTEEKIFPTYVKAEVGKSKTAQKQFNNLSTLSEFTLVDDLTDQQKESINVCKGVSIESASIAVKIGEQIMTTTNQDGYQNGSLGVIVGLKENGVDVLFDTGQIKFVGYQTFVYEQELYHTGNWRLAKNYQVGQVWSNLIDAEEHLEKTYHHPEGVPFINPVSYISHGAAIYVKRLPIIPAYAMTVHKAQGQTINGTIWIDLDSIAKMRTTSGLLYVALSRVKSPEQIVLSRDIRVSDIIIDSKVSELYKKFDEIAESEKLKWKNETQ